MQRLLKLTMIDSYINHSRPKRKRRWTSPKEYEGARKCQRFIFTTHIPSYYDSGDNRPHVSHLYSGLLFLFLHNETNFQQTLKATRRGYSGNDSSLILCSLNVYIRSFSTLSDINLNDINFRNKQL